MWVNRDRVRTSARESSGRSQPCPCSSHRVPVPKPRDLVDQGGAQHFPSFGALILGVTRPGTAARGDPALLFRALIEQTVWRNQPVPQVHPVPWPYTHSHSVPSALCVAASVRLGPVTSNPGPQKGLEEGQGDTCGAQAQWGEAQVPQPPAHAHIRPRPAMSQARHVPGPHQATLNRPHLPRQPRQSSVSCLSPWKRGGPVLAR